MAAEPSLEASIKVRLAPALREDGFSGSGRNFRRLNGDMIDLLQIQGSMGGDAFYINLAIQPVGAPCVLGELPDFKKLKVQNCLFSRRLEPARHDRWSYGLAAASMDAAVDDAKSVYSLDGRAAFATASGPHSVLKTVTASQLANGDVDLAGFGGLGIGTIQSLAVMRFVSGDRVEASAFARLGLSHGARTGLRDELEAIIAGTWSP